MLSQGWWLLFLLIIFCIIGTSIPEIKIVKAAFHTCFEISNLKLCKFYLGITVIKDCKNQILQPEICAYSTKILIDDQIIDFKSLFILLKT